MSFNSDNVWDLLRQIEQRCTGSGSKIQLQIVIQVPPAPPGHPDLERLKRCATAISKEYVRARMSALRVKELKEAVGDQFNKSIIQSALTVYSSAFEKTGKGWYRPNKEVVERLSGICFGLEET